MKCFACLEFFKSILYVWRIAKTESRVVTNLPYLQHWHLHRAVTRVQQQLVAHTMQQGEEALN